MYEYLTGVLIMSALWIFFFLVRKDLRKAMLWSGAFYTILLTVVFWVRWFIYHDPLRAITPGYWAPHTLFDLGKTTGGYAIEDLLFMFFAAGIATALYEFCLKEKISAHSDKNLKTGYVFLFGFAGMFVFHQLFYLNDMYLLIAFNFFGVMPLLWQRRDLIRHSLFGGIIFLFLYILGFSIWIHIYPNLINDIYQLNLTSGIIWLGIPLEEYLYALSFGMLWAPIYEYQHRFKDKRISKS